MDVHNQLGFGFLEKVYENALMVALGDRDVHAVQQAPIKVRYRNVEVGNYFADILVENKVILELKAKANFASVDEAQLLNYLRATSIRIGLLLNFGPTKLQYKRLVY